MEPLPGYKTYIVGVAMIAYALLGTLLGKLDPAHAGEVVMQGFGLIFLRLGIANDTRSVR